MTLGRVLILVMAATTAEVSTQAQHREAKLAGPAVGVTTPAPEMVKRNWVVGTWSVTERHEKTDLSPGGTGTGTSVITLGPGGHSQLITYNSNGPAGKYSGHGIIGWDPEAKVYRAAWADSMTRGVVTTDCREESKDWVCVGETVTQGKKITTRSRSIAPSPAGWTEVTEVSTDGQPFTKVRAFEFKRAK